MKLFLLKPYFVIAAVALISHMAIAQPVSMPQNTSPVCKGDPVTLLGTAYNTTGTVTYEWTAPDNSTISSQNASITPTQDGWYRLKVTDVNGSDTASTLVIVNNQPIVSMLGINASYCANITSDSIFLQPNNGNFSIDDVVINDNVTDFMIIDPSAMGVGSHDIKYAITEPNDNPLTIFQDDFSRDRGWQGYDGATRIWERAAANSTSTCTAGSSDPTTDHTASTTDNYVLGSVVGGCYLPNQATTKWIESPVFNLTNKTDISVEFYTIIKLGANDHFTVEYFDGTQWRQKIKYTSFTNESNWAQKYYIIDSASNNPNFKIRFGFGPTDGSGNYPGVSIDDFKISGFASNTCADSLTINTVVNEVPTVDLGTNKEICNGNSVSLSAVTSMPTTYQWSHGPITNPVIVNPATTKVYTVTVEGSGSCTATDRITVTVNSTPNASITPNPATLCSGNGVTLTASGGTSYGWSNGPVVATNTITPSSSTTYTVTVTDTKGCSSTVSASVTVNANATANAGNDQELCKGNSTSLTGSYSGGAPGGTYAWSNGATNAITNVSPASTTTYTVTVTMVNGCTSTDAVVISVNTPPTASAGNDQEICIGAMAVLSANGGSIYKWSNGVNTQINMVSPIENTTYIVTVTDNKLCTAVDSVVVTPKANPIASIIDQNVCKGFTETLTVTGGVSYIWNTGEITASIVKAPVATTTYTVTVTDALGCTDSESGILTVLPTAPLTTGGDPTICPNSDAVLTASGCSTYLWNNGETTPSITVNPAAKTTYTVTGTDVNGCTASDNIIVSIGSQLIPAIIPNTTICKGSSTTLVAGPGPLYTWNTGATSSSITVSPTVQTTYSVTVDDGISCSGSTSVIVSVSAIPTANITASANNVCSGTNINLTAFPGAHNYNWNQGAGTRAITISPLVTKTYSVTVTDPISGCSSSKDFIVTIKPTPTVTAVDDVTICTNGSTELASSLTSGTYLWNTGATTQKITVSPLVTSTYTLTYTENGCTSSDQVVVTMSTEIFPSAGVDKSMCRSKATQLQASGGTIFTWNASPTLSSTTISNPIATPPATTTYTVTVSDGFCTGTDEVIVTVYAIPTVDAGQPATICNGEAVTLSGDVNGPLSTVYEWLSGENTEIINVSPIITTTYTLTATNKICTASDNVVVTVNNLPPADAGENDTICSTHPGHLTATGGTSYLWSSGDITASITKQPLVTTTYTVTVTLNGCTATDNAVIVVNETPTVNANSDTIVCQGSPASLSVFAITSGGSKVYAWSSGSTSAAFTDNPVTTTTYTVTVTDPSCGCTNTDVVIVTVNPLPTVSAGGNKSLCTGKTVSLTATGGTTYKWSNNATTAITDVFPISTTTYSVTVTDNNLCTNTDKAVVSVNALPTASAGTDKTICASSTATLTATGGVTYVWNTTAITNTISVNPNATTTYTVTVSNAALCTATDEAIVFVNSIPTVNLGVDAGICLGGSALLNAVVTGGDGANVYAWSNSASTASITVNPLVKTTYTVSVTDGKLCSGTDAIIIDIVTELHPNAGNDTSICLGSAVQFNCTGGVNFKWSPSTSLNFDNIGNPISTPVTNMTYTVSVNDGGGCSGSDDIIITVNPLPTAGISNADTVCRDLPVQISATGGVSYLWNGGQTTDKVTITPHLTATYTVSVYNTFNCYDTATVAIHVHPDPPAYAGKDTAICPGNTITLTATGGGQFLWSAGNQTTASISVSPAIPTIYYVTVTNLVTGCTDYDSVIVSLNPIPTADITGISKICEGESATLTASGGDTYLWSETSTTESINITPVTQTTYTVTVYNNYGCTHTDSWVLAVDSTPVANAGTDIASCDGKAITFTASGGQNYIWDHGDLTAATTVLPATSTTYTVTVSYNNGCIDTDEVVGVVNTNPNVQLGSDVTICPGGQSLLNPIVSGGDGTYTYIWSNALTTTSITVQPATSTTYSVTVTDGNGCSDTDRKAVIIGSALVVSISADTLVCPGSCVPLNASGGINYNWSGGLGITSSPTACPTVSTTYIVTVDDGANCSGTEDVVITLQTPPAVNISAYAPSFCNGDATLLHSDPATSYTWSTAEISSSIMVQPTTTQTYTLTVLDNLGCSNSESIIITVYQNPDINLGNDVGVCKDGQTTIKAIPTGGDGTYSFLWDNNSTADEFTFAPTDSITFTVTVTDGKGCTDADDIIVYVDTILRITVTPDTAACINSCVQLSVNGGLNYTWSPALGLSDVNSQNPMACPTVQTTYYVDVNDGSTCTARDTVVVSINALPVADAGTSSPVCAGSDIILSASGGVAYTWSDGGNSAQHQITPANSAIYTVTVYDINACSDVDDVTVIVNPNPTVNAGPDIGICLNGSTAITQTTTGGSGTNTYLWSDFSASTSITVAPLVNTLYSVTVTDINGCSDSDEILVTIDTEMHISISDTFACTSNCVQLLVNGGLNYTWSPATGLSSTSIANPIACPTAQTTYTVTVNDGNTCTATTSVVVGIKPLPTVDAGNNAEICEGFSAGLTATSNGSLSWSTTETSPTIMVTPPASSWYTVTATSAFGCTAKDSVRVVVNQNPIINLGNNIGVCKDGQTNIKAIPSSGDGTYSFLWSNANTTSEFLYAPTDSITFTVTVTDGKGCTDEDDVIVYIDTVLRISVTPDTAACLNNCVQLAVNGGLNYTWSPALSLSDINSQNPLACPTVQTTYYVDVNDGSTCTARDTVVVSINALPIAEAGTGSTVCDGNIVTLQASGGILYAWSNGANEDINNVTPSITSTYTVTVFDANQCSDDDVVVVTINPNPSVNLGPDVGICLQGSASISQLTTGGSGGNMYHWSETSTTPSIIVTPLTDTHYTVTVTDIKGCSDTDELLVYIDTEMKISISDTFACNTNCIQLLVNGGLNYSWSPSTNLSSTSIANPIACPVAQITYTVSVNDGKTCSATTDVVVSVKPLPSVDAGSNAEICAGFTTTLNATSDGSLLWNTNETSSAITVEPATSSWYKVTASTLFGCTAKDSVYVLVNINPDVDMGADVGVCKDGSTMLHAKTTKGDGNYSYLWNNNVTVPDIEVTPTDSITFTVTVTDGKGCSDADDIIVYIDSVLRLQSTPDTTICMLNSLELYINGGLNYAWSPSISLNETEIPNPIASPLVNTTYIVTVNDGGHCTAYDTVVVSISALPTANAGLPVSVCEGTTVSLQASGGIDYAWSHLATTAISLVTPTLTTTYTVTVFNAAQCTDTDEIVITVNSNPTVNAGPDIGICKDGSTNISISIDGGTEDYNYLWNNGYIVSSFVASPTVATTYAVTVSDANTCTDSDEMVVTIGNKLQIFLSEDTSICAGNCVQLLVNGGINYSWSPPVNLDNIHISNPTACPGANTTYIVRVDDGNNCTTVDSIVVNLLPLPEATVETDKSAGAKICSGSSTTLRGVGGVGYIWGTGETTNTITVSPLVSTQYIVSVLNNFGCADKDSILIEVHELPEVDLGPNAGICMSSSTNLTAVPSKGLAPYEFMWNTMQTSRVITASPVVRTTYTHTVTDANGCSNTDDVVIFLGAQLVPSAGPDLDICLHDSVQLIVNGGKIFQWAPATTLVGSTTQTPIAFPSATTTYIVTADDGVTCSGRDTIVVRVNALPTPNAGIDQKICLGDPVNLQASGGILYEWSTGKNKESITEYPDTSTTYIVSASNIYGCTDDDQVFVRVSFPVADAGTQHVICGGYAVTLTAQSDPVNSTYLWSNSETKTTNTVTPLADTYYSVTVTDTIGCTDSDDVLVTIQVTPQPQMLSTNNKTVYCKDDAAFLFLNYNYYTYNWSTGSNTDKIELNQTDDYLVTVTDSLGCILTAGPRHFVVDPVPVAAISHIDTAGLTIYYHNFSMDGVSYLWEFGDNTTSTDPEPIHTYSSAGKYFVKLTATNQCDVKKDSMWVEVHEKSFFGIHETPTSQLLDIFPNPTQQDITVKMTARIQTSTLVSVYNLVGEVIMQKQIELLPGEQSFSVDLSKHAKGLYTLELKTDNSVQYAKIVKE